MRCMRCALKILVLNNRLEPVFKNAEKRVAVAGVKSSSWF